MRGRLERAARDPVLAPYRLAFSSALARRAPSDRRARRDAPSGYRRAPDTCLYPSIAVYVGSGASHSWIWFADLLERCGLFDVDFVDETRVSGSGLERFDFLLLGGGDTYAMADSLGGRGAEAIDDFVERGGLYYGSCAGAYLVLTGVDAEPFAPFALLHGNMLNVMADPPAPRCLEHKYLARYGEEWVFHPVYGELFLEAAMEARDFPCFAAAEALAAPLLGGPVMSADDARDVLAVFSVLSRHAAYLWPREQARALLDGRAAVCATERGEGSVMVSGPHLEHPLFPCANALVAEMFSRHCMRPVDSGHGPASGITAHPDDGRAGAIPAKDTPGDSGAALLEVKRQVSNSRIVAFGLEKIPVTWTIGLKVWEPEKVRMFLEVAWFRLPYVQAAATRVPAEPAARLAEGYSSVTEMVKSLKIKVESGEDSLADAESLLVTLKELTASFLWLYFRLRLEDGAVQD